ncbi:MAG: hypothetical protein NC930_03635 [Candidatus Omnitrophica bacterium]|nr:hypothetical protein [Candidatus Omnitrophota bacterium]
MGGLFLRTYREYDLEDVQKHLLIMGDLTADCASCRNLGLDAGSVKNCPQCGTNFKYLTSRRLDQHPGERFQLVQRMREKRPDLIFIDYSDYMKSIGQKKARDFFG